MHNATLLQEELERLGLFLSRLARPPAIATVARSVDGYARIFDVGRFEEETLSMLRRTFGQPPRGLTPQHPRTEWAHALHDVCYAPGTSPLEALSALTDLNLCPGLSTSIVPAPAQTCL